MLHSQLRNRLFLGAMIYQKNPQLCCVQIHHSIQGISGWADLSKPLDISLSTGPLGDNPNAYSINEASFNPIRVGDFIGSIAMGGSANCEVLTLCAHGNATHTECVGHITKNRIVLGDVLKQFWFSAQLISMTLSDRGFVSLGDANQWNLLGCDALVVRSLPNGKDKRSQNWSGNEPPYFTPDALAYLRDLGIQHLLTDFPSVDPESDEGKLQAHHEWWGLPQRSMAGITETIPLQHPRFSSTITELIFVPDSLFDGVYMLNLQIPNLCTDAVPSRPVLYAWNTDKQ